jgi:penicillin-insensitive murein endopeptidase
MNVIRTILLGLAILTSGGVTAQDKGTFDPQPLPPLAHPDDPSVAAKELFGRQDKPAALPPRSIGGYARGCVAGAAAIPTDGETWQVMRLSRNRSWGHPDLIAFLRRLSAKVPNVNGWPGLLIGDISQPRGGPMITGHASHQIGLDADLWLTPMPSHRLTRHEREQMSATNVVRPDGLDIDPRSWTPQHTALLRAAATERNVARIFVNPAIKKALCREAGQDRAWLRKIRPMWGHNYHFHIRLSCPDGDGGCADQDAPPPGDGCGAELALWFRPDMLHPKPGKPRPPLTLAQLPAECRRILTAP